MDNIAYTGNIIEAALWILFALLFAFKAIKSLDELRRLFSILAITFFIFGISDVIESQTGAWWQPLWLLLMKAGCIIVFLFGFYKYYNLQKY